MNSDSSLGTHAIRRSLLVLLVLGAVSCHGPGHATSSAVPRAGPLVVVGGGGTTLAIQNATLNLAGGLEAHVVVLPQASASETRGVGSVEMWQDLGAKDVQNLDPLDGPDVRAAIESADLIWMPGGSQSRLMEALQEAGLVELIRSRHRTGAVVGGTSAGAAVLSTHMIKGGDSADLESVRRSGTELAPGLGLWPDALVDQHFVKRRRHNRLLSAVLDHPLLIGVGIDERTAVILSDGEIRVVGDGTVSVYDARGAEVQETEEQATLGAFGVLLHLLRAGMRFKV